MEGTIYREDGVDERCRCALKREVRAVDTTREALLQERDLILR